MQRSKEELKEKINELEIDDDKKIELLEDIEDSMTVKVESEDEKDEAEKIEKAEYERVIRERDEIKQKYKERFLHGDEVPESKEDVDEVEEKIDEIIDVKEI